jgi:hypothetical protein
VGRSAVALLLGLVLIPESRSAVAPRPDYTGLLLSTFGLAALAPSWWPRSWAGPGATRDR